MLHLHSRCPVQASLRLGGGFVSPTSLAPYLFAYARFKPAMSIFFILSIASMTLPAFFRSLSATA